MPLSATDVGTRYLDALADVLTAEVTLGRIQAELAKQREAESEAWARKAEARTTLRNLELEVLEQLTQEADQT